MATSLVFCLALFNALGNGMVCELCQNIYHLFMVLNYLRSCVFSSWLGLLLSVLKVCI